MKIMASGVCHTDVHAADGDWPVQPGLPFVPGHEGAGIVAALGPGVKGLREGDPWESPGCTMPAAFVNTASPAGKRSASRSTTAVTASTAPSRNTRSAPRPTWPVAERADFAALAPILCAGVTTYKGIKETEARPGEWIAISGVGGLGHIAIQYARAMGLHVVAVDVSDDKLALARTLGADIAIDGRAPSAVEDIVKRTGGGAHGVLVTAVSVPAFGQALRMVRRKGTVSLVGLPPGDFPAPIFDVVLKRITIRGSIVGTRQDLAEALAFAAEGKVRACINHARLEDVNDVFTALKAGRVDGRMVLDIGVAAPLAATTRGGHGLTATPRTRRKRRLVRGRQHTAPSTSEPAITSRSIW